MIIDPKLQRMFENCRARKNRLDKRRKTVRAVMFTPPAMIMLLSLVNYAARLLSGTALLLMGGLQGGGFSAGPVTFILSVIVTGYVAGETMLDSEPLIKYSLAFYPAAGVLGLAALVLINLEKTLFGLLLPAFCFVNIPLNFIFKRLYAENETLKPLKGYPHFNPILLSERDLRGCGADPEDKPNLEEMSPDERLMYEREH